MPNGLHVNAGEVIRSGYINQLVDRIEALEQRVTLLEGQPSANRVVIDEFIPPVQIQAAQILTVKGNHFAFPTDQNRVEIDGFVVPPGNFRDPSTSTQLRFVVPQQINVPAGGQNVTIRIITPTNGSTSRGYRLLPAPVVPGLPPKISAIQPQTVRIGGAATIIGENFATVPGNNTVVFINKLADGSEELVPVTEIKDTSTTEQLNITVPVIQMESATEKIVVVEVSVGALTPDTKKTRVKPAV